MRADIAAAKGQIDTKNREKVVAEITGVLMESNNERRKIMDENQLSNAIEKAFENLEGEKPGSDSYSKQVNDICKLYELQLTEEKLADARNSEAMQRGEDSEKLIHEEAMKKEETKQAMFKVGADVGKTLLTIGAYAIWIWQILTFEENGTVHSFASKFIGKPKI